MSQNDFISVKKNPQYQIQFKNNNEANNLPIITWVAITKLLIKQNNIEEDPEKSTDYLAMHVFQNNSPGQKVMSATNPLIKSTYTND